MDANTWALIPLLMVGLLFATVGGGYGYHALTRLQAHLARRKATKLHLALNVAEIEIALLAQRVRTGNNPEPVKALLYWLDLETPRLKGEDAGLLLSPQERVLALLEVPSANGKNGSG